MERYIFIDPDGTEEFGLLLIVAAKTKITYGHQCSGLACETRETEGYLVPLGRQTEGKLITFFKKYNGWPPNIKNETWLEADIQTLRQITSEIIVWDTSRSGEQDSPTNVVLDLERLDQMTEGWLPVVTVYGSGILIFVNSD